MKDNRFGDDVADGVSRKNYIRLRGIIRLCLFLIVFVDFPLFADDTAPAGKKIDAGVTIITIVNARRTDYSKDKISGDDCIILKGSVTLSVKKGNTTTVISADEVNYNRATDMLYASGSVSLSQTGGTNGSENITASSLLFNTATLEGIFDDGRVVQAKSDSINLPSGSTLIVSSDIFGRADSGTIAFKRGELTFCDDENPHWRIKATRIWLLPGNEFAFFNALLYVGYIPVLYLPAFYYPKDELLFNPVFGLRSREGYFFQTTTYILGRKPLDKSSDSSDDDDDTSKALYNFMRPTTLKEQERQGLMLHNLDEDYTGTTDNYLKLMADWYANLGAMTGIAGAWKGGKYISSISGDLQLGFSNTIFENGSTYLPYSSTGVVYSDSSSFLGLRLPFRYSADIDISVSKPFTLKLTMPIYSDPYFTYDFGDRSETMDWISYLLSNPTTASDDNSSTTTISSFSWSLSGSYSAKVPDFLSPYVSKLAISSFSSSVAFSSLTLKATQYSTGDNWATYTPERKFFYPSQIVPLNISFGVSGTIFSFNSGDRSTAVGSSSVTYEFPLSAPDDLNTQTEKSTSETSDAQKNDSSESNGNTVPATDKGESENNSASADRTSDSSDDSSSDGTLPDIAFSPSAVEDLDLLSYSLTYSISPSYTSQIAYSSSNLSSSDDFSWDDMKSRMYILKLPTTFTSALAYCGSLFSMNDTLSFSPVLQRHPYISTDYYTTSGIASLKKADYTASKLELSSTNAISLKPFYYTEHFKDTGITYKTTFKLLRTEFVGDSDNPEWDYLTLDWSNDDSITKHSLDFTFASEEHNQNYSQSLTLSTMLPPEVDEYDGTLKLVFPFTTFTVTSGIKQTSATDTTWEKEDVKQALAVSLFSDTFKLTQSYNYDLEDNHSDALKLALSWSDLQLAYVMQYTYGYDFDSDDGWVERDNKEFLPYNASIAYSTTNKKFTYWKNRISFAPSLSTSLVADFLRPTNSYFKFIPAITFKINDFLDLTFSSESRNSVCYRYVQDFLGNSGLVPGETDVLTDLLDSFDFADDTKRKSSGFKLKSFEIKLTHNLHDWDMNLDFKVSPRFISTTRTYDFSPYFSLSVLWRPMESMKTEIVDDYGSWELNPSDDNN